MKTIQNISFVLLLSLFLFACNDDDENCTAVPNVDCNCFTLYDPVCGCNDVTYGNSCEAECNGITEYTSGECN